MEKRERFARSILNGFESYFAEFQNMTLAAKSRFEEADWLGMQQASIDRIDLYKVKTNEVLKYVKIIAGDDLQDLEFWREVRGIYSDERYLAPEVKRWNLFRKAQIHVVGIGNAPMEALHVVFGPYRGWETMKVREATLADTQAVHEVFSSVRRQYDAYLQRPSLFMRMRGRNRLARTRDPRALDVLAKSYGSRNPINLVRATIRGLQEMQSPENVAAKRGKSVDEVMANHG